MKRAWGEPVGKVAQDPSHCPPDRVFYKSQRNRTQMTKREAKANFLAVSVPEGLNDKPAMRYAWGLYTDLLCKEGYITLKQYETWTCPFWCSKHSTNLDLLKNISPFTWNSSSSLSSVFSSSITMTQDNSQQNDSTMQQNSSTPEHKQNNSSITSSTNITEETKQDWNDFWYNSESEGKESKPQHLSEYVNHQTKEWSSLSIKKYSINITLVSFHSSTLITSPFVSTNKKNHQKKN